MPAASQRRPPSEPRGRKTLSRRVAFVATLILLIAAAVVVVVCLYRPVGAASRVILISIDTLRADRLGCYGYDAIETPHLDRIAAEGLLFENAATTTPLTLPAHASLFTGRSPLGHGVLDNFGFDLPENETTLAEILTARGFTTGGFVGSFVLDSRWGVAQGFETYRDDFDALAERESSLLVNQKPGDQVLEPALAWIRERKDQPFFAFLHFYDPHTPYGPPEPYRSRYGPDPLRLYDGEVAYVDSLIGELIAELERLGIYEDSLIVVVGDHGESLGEHGEETHGFFIYDATVRVPLIFRGPAIPMERRARAQVRTIDLAPTILDLLGIESRADMEGVSLRSVIRDPESDPGLVAYVESHYPRLHFGWAPLFGLRTERYKFIEAPRRELYDLNADPDEKENLAASGLHMVDQLARRLERMRAGQTASRVEPVVSDPETEERLRSLGYLTFRGSAPRAERSGETLADPKDKIDVFNRVNEARVAHQMGRIEEAADLLAGVIEEDPEVMLAHLLLGNIWLKQREFEKAGAVFEQALARNDASIEAVYGLALAYKGRGMLEEAAAGFERCLALDEDQTRALYQLAETRMSQDRAGEAERLIRAALARSFDTSLALLLAESLLAQGKRADALGVLTRAREQDEGNALVHLSIGNVLMDHGGAEAALDSYRKAAEIAPENPQIWNALGNALARRGDDRGAHDAFRRAVELDDSFAAAQNNLGISLARLNRLSEAERAFHNAIESDPDYAEAHNNLGFLYLQVGAREQAIILLRRALSLKPDYPEAKANLELALQRNAKSP